MKQLRKLAQYYVDVMVKLGLVRFSILLAPFLLFLPSPFKSQLQPLYTVKSNVSMLSGRFFLVYWLPRGRFTFFRLWSNSLKSLASAWPAW